mmetsp:Transcript_10539/g.20614  ORF Transcript_10539/g.20614 Transcript_10539/m.20614 type:complete len:89 (-) Transcript_10539:44-310(-)
MRTAKSSRSSSIVASGKRTHGKEIVSFFNILFSFCVVHMCIRDDSFMYTHIHVASTLPSDVSSLYAVRCHRHMLANATRRNRFELSNE